METDPGIISQVPSPFQEQSALGDGATAETTVLDWLNLLYGQVQGNEYAVLMQRQGVSPRFTPYAPRDWLEAHQAGQVLIPEVVLHDLRNTYTTVNTFHRKWFVHPLVKRLNALFVDVDCHNPARVLQRGGVSGEEMWAHLQATGWFEAQGLPEPVAVASGQGLYLMWFLEGEHTLVPGRGNRWVWERCQEKLNELLKPFGADPVAKDVSRFLRVVGTPHANGKQVRLLNKPGDRHTLDSMAEALGVVQVWDLPRRGPMPRRGRQTSRVPVHFDRQKFGRYTLGHNRLHDLAVVNDRVGGFKEGVRNFALLQWVTSSWVLVCQQPDLVRQEAQRFNEGLDPPLPAGEVDRVVDAVLRQPQDLSKRHDRRIASNKTLIRVLGIPASVQEALLTIISQEEKDRRRAARQKETEVGRKVLEVYWQNPLATQAQLAAQAGVSQPTVSRVLKAIGWQAKGRGRPRKAVWEASEGTDKGGEYKPCSECP